jgi:hypothetical protein
MAVPAPQKILEILSGPPPAPATNNWGTWASSNDKTFPEGVMYEWGQASAPLEEYDQFSIVGTSGWIIEQPDESQSDFPFDHPFGVSVFDSSKCGFTKPWDWEFQMALDNKNGYANLFSPANTIGEDGGPLPTFPDSIAGLAVPNGTLGVEMDSALLPQSFRSRVNAGDRVAIFGRWILDQGHDTPVNGVNGKQYRTEIHPPLVLATGSVQQVGNGPQFTQVLFMSRPFLVGQTYCLDPKNAYQDGVDDDGGYWDHLLKELVKVIGPPVINILGIGESWKVEAHPKIKSYPFKGVQILHFIVRPPPPITTPGHIHIGPITGTQPSHVRLEVSYQFTVRSGCAVQVMSTAEGQVDVIVVLNSAGYNPPQLPNRRDRNYSRQELDCLSKGTGTKILELDALMTALGLLTGGPVDAVKVAAVLSTGIKTDEYDSLPEVNILDAGKAVNAYADNIPAGQGITVNDDQPYPIYGWLTTKWVDVPLVSR